jgi:hypothetical protein
MADSSALSEARLTGTGTEAADSQLARQKTAAIKASFDEFDSFVVRAEDYLKRGELETAAAYCAIAANVATRTHAGVFASPRIEAVLSEIGRRAPGPDAGPRPRPKEIKRILHVTTQANQVGGHTKMLCLWAEADSTREHCLVLTQHRGQLPGFTRATFGKTRKVERLNRRPGGLISAAKQLRRIASTFDLIILHTHCEDVVPLIAFAETEKHPPMAILNHADHLFWLGPGPCHLAINLRDAAQDLAILRRGVAPERNILMPTLSESGKRTRTREEAKKEIGIDPDAILMFSAARKTKYRTTNGVSFADIHASVLAKNPKAVLLVCGSGDQPDWEKATQASGRRIISLPETAAPQVYFEAGDIYVDSYPFVSSTSMMEAAGYGMPTVTLFTAPDAARIIGINHVALVGASQQARSFEQYEQILDRLIRDPAERKRIGDKGHDGVARDHNLPGWMTWLEAVYHRVTELSPPDTRHMSAAREHPFFGEPDCRHQEIFGSIFPTVRFLKNYIGMMPPQQHLKHWNEIRRAGGFGGAGEAATYLMPEWLKRIVKDDILRRE